MKNACGFVLAAGFGTRLRPLTSRLPKPMIRFFGAPLLDLALFRFRSAGISNIAVNAHYLAKEIESGLKASPWGKDVKLSIEDPVILGRGGAYIPLRAWFGKKTIIAYNGDIISDIDVAAALAHHRAKGAMATMVVLPKPLGRDNAVYCAGDGRVGAIAKTPPAQGGPWTARGFACLQILEPEFLDFLPPDGESDILNAYAQAISGGHVVTSFVHSGFWHDLGSPAQLLQAHIDLLEAGQAQEKTVSALGLDAFHEASHSSLAMISPGQTWQSPTGNLIVKGPSSVITGKGALTASNAKSNAKIELGPLVVVEIGFSTSGPFKAGRAIIYRSANIDHMADHIGDHRGVHSNAIFDHSHLIRCDHA